MNNMSKFTGTGYKWLVSFGFDPIKMISAARGLQGYFRDLWALKVQRLTAVRDFPFGSAYPCLEDRFAESGTANGHYFHQDLLVARRIHLNNPETHVDVGSRIDG